MEEAEDKAEQAGVGDRQVKAAGVEKERVGRETMEGKEDGG